MRIMTFRDSAGAAFEMRIAHGRDGMTLTFEGTSSSFAFEAVPEEPSRFAVVLGGVRRKISVALLGDAATVFDGPQPVKLTLADPFAAAAIGADKEMGAIAPMPGTVIALVAKSGELLDEGAPMLVLEAMKMEHTLRAPSRGRVTAYRCAVGDFVAEGTALAEFEADSKADNA